LALCKGSVASRRQIDDGNAEGHVCIDRLFGGILINCICGRAKLGAAVDVGSDHPEDYPCKMCGAA